MLNLADAAKRLCTMVKTDLFLLVKPISNQLHVFTTWQEALEWGNFRGEGEEVSLTPRVAIIIRARSNSGANWL